MGNVVVCLLGTDSMHALPHGVFLRFNDKLKSLLDKEPYSSMTATQLYKKMVDYLFLVWQEGSFASLCCNWQYRYSLL